MSDGKKNIILTGDRPTGPLHIGHYVGSLKRRVALQESGKFIPWQVVTVTTDGKLLD